MGERGCWLWAGLGAGLGAEWVGPSGRLPVSSPAGLSPGLIIVNAWYGKFVNDKSKKNEKVKVIDVTVPLQCLVKDSKLILTEASKVHHQGILDPCSKPGSIAKGSLGSRTT